MSSGSTDAVAAPVFSASRAAIARATGVDWLTGLLRPYRHRIAALVALGLIAALAALVPPWLTKLVIDEGLMAGDAAALIRWSLALLAFGALTLVLGAITSVLHMRASVAMLADLRRMLARAVLDRPAGWRARQRTGEIMARLDSDAGEVQQFAFNLLLTGTSSALRLIGGATMLFILAWPLALIALLLAPFEAAFVYWARPRTEVRSREARAARGRLAAQMTEMVQATPQIQAAAGEGPVAAAIGRAQGALNRALVRAHLWSEVTRGGPALLTALMRSAVFIAGGLMVIDGRLSLGTLIAFIAYLAFLVGPMQALFGLWHARARLSAALERLDGVMQPIAEGPVWMAKPLPLPEGRGALRLEGVGARTGGQLLFSDLDAEIPPGTRLRLTGASGTGKSTLLALLQRHTDPEAGRILLDGNDIRMLARDELRRAAVLVPQRPFLLAGTVADNLALSAPESSREAMQAALDDVQMSARFATVGGLDAPLGEDGLTLSGGERQRLCLARALLVPFRVLLLDEALSEVDPVTVAAIMEAIETGHPGRTRIVVTHGHASAHGPFDAELSLDAVARCH